MESQPQNPVFRINPENLVIVPPFMNGNRLTWTIANRGNPDGMPHAFY